MGMDDALQHCTACCTFLKRLCSMPTCVGLPVTGGSMACRGVARGGKADKIVEAFGAGPYRSDSHRSRRHRICDWPERSQHSKHDRLS